MMYGMASTKLQTRALDDAVYEAIRDRIVSGELRPGDPVVEAQLSSEFGISKTPVREALIALGRDGLVDQVPYHVTRVATPKADDINQVCELRSWLEGEIAAEGALSSPPPLLRDLERSIVDARAALADRDLPAYTAAIDAFSDLLLAHSENRFAIQLVQRLRNILALIVNVAQLTAGRRERSIDEHAAIYDAMVAGDPEATRAATRVHMLSIEKDALRALEKLSVASEPADSD